MFKKYLVFFAIALLCLSPLVEAHHSASEYDLANGVTVEGVIREVKVSNPHMKLVLEVTDDKGAREITYEGHSRNNLYRRGWRPGMLNVGDKITITIGPTRDGSDGGYVLGVVTKDGKEF